MSREHRMPAQVRRIVMQCAVVVCPTEIADDGLLAALVDEMEEYFAELPRRLRLALFALFISFDQSTRFVPGSRPRRFADLNRDQAMVYVERCLTGRLGPRRTVITLLKGIITFNYYELPQVKERLGYTPARYIAEVSERRLRMHGEDVRRGEAALLTDGEGT